MKLSIVIPVYNAEKTIMSLCAALYSLYAHQFELEVVLINDGSKDRTDEVCRKLHGEYRGMVAYLKLSKNFGEHSALMAGIRFATGDYCVTMDDDFQNPPEEVSRLVDTISKGYDVVYASYDVKRDNLFRNMGSKIHNMVATYVLEKPRSLYLSSFKIMNRFVMDEVKQYTGPDPYLDGIILRSTDNIGTVKVAHNPRLYGNSGYTFKKLLSLWGNMVVNFSLYPLRLIGIIGLIMTCYGLYDSAGTIYEILSPRVDPSGYDTLLSVISFFRGFQLLAISVVGEYVGRIYLSLNQSPQYIIRSRLPAKAERRDQETAADREVIRAENH